MVIVYLLDFSKVIFNTWTSNELRIDAYRMEPVDSIDLVLIGSSEITADYSAGYAYKEFGFTSYPYSVDAAPVSLWDAMLEDVLAYQNPDLIVIETNGMFYTDEKTIYGNAARHFVLDHMPVSSRKLNEVRSIAKDNVYIDPSITFFLPFIKYHSEWNKIEEKKTYIDAGLALKQRGYSVLKGNYTNTAKDVMTTVSENKGIVDEEKLHPLSEQYLRDFLEGCRKRGISNILFTSFPHVITQEEGNRYYNSCKMANYASHIFEEYGYDYVNFESCFKEIGLDPKIDFYNEGHMNFTGQRKFTDFFSRFLLCEYGLTSTKTINEDVKKMWDTTAEYYQLFYEYAKDLYDKGEKKSLAETPQLLYKLEEMK